MALGYTDVLAILKTNWCGARRNKRSTTRHWRVCASPCCRQLQLKVGLLAVVVGEAVGDAVKVLFAPAQGDAGKVGVVDGVWEVLRLKAGAYNGGSVGIVGS